MGPVLCCGVEERELEDVCVSDVPERVVVNAIGLEEEVDAGSKDISSLAAADEARGRRGCGGVVRFFSSMNVSQNPAPFELRRACCLKLEEPPESVIMSSSSIASACVGPNTGDDCI